MKGSKSRYISPKVEVYTILVEQGFAGSKENDNGNGGTTAPEWGII